MADVSQSELGNKTTTPEKPLDATVQAVVDGFLADVLERVKPNTFGTYSGLLKPFAEHFGGVNAVEFTSAKLIAFTHRPGWGSSHRHNLIGAISTAFKWANASGLIAINPLNGVKRLPKASRGTKAIIDDATHQKLLEASTPSLRLLLTLLHETGARPSELSRLTAAELDLNNGVALLSEHKTADSTGNPNLPRRAQLGHIKEPTVAKDMPHNIHLRCTGRQKVVILGFSPNLRMECELFLHRPVVAAESVEQLSLEA